MRWALSLSLGLLASSAEASTVFWPDASSLEAGRAEVSVGGVVQPYDAGAGVEYGSAARVRGRYALSDRISVRGSGFGTGSLPLTGGTVTVDGRLFDEERWRVSLYSAVVGASVGESGPLVAGMVGTAFQSNWEHVQFDCSIPLFAVGILDLQDGTLAGSTSELVLPLASELSVSWVLGDHHIRGGVFSLLPMVGYRFAPETGWTAEVDVGVLPHSTPTPLLHLEVGYRF